MAATSRNKMFPCILLFILFPMATLSAQGTEIRQVALVPFWGVNQEIITGFGDEVFIGVRALVGFQPVQIDMGNLPPGVPEGGFPPFVSPGPALTRGMPFAITGETNYNADTSQWHLRLFLWSMAENRLIFSDEMAVPNRQTLAVVMPGMVDWLFSWIPPPAPDPVPAPVAQVMPQVILEGQQVIVVQGAENVRNWLYVGLRAGVPSNLDLGEINVAPSLNFQFLNFGGRHSLGLQLECIFANIDNLDNLHITVPALLRFTARRESSFLSLLVGANIVWLGEDVNIDEDINIDRFIWDNYWNRGNVAVGLGLGTRFGPGYLFSELRWSSGNLNQFGNGNLGRINVSIGYNIGFFRR